MSPTKPLLDAVAQKLQTLRTAKLLYQRQLAPDFSIFDYIDTSELGLSAILADLLDPNGSHAQNQLFLEKFIRICLPVLSEQSAWQRFTGSLSETKIATEEPTSAIGAYRRMDIYLSHRKLPEFGICIENKPYAADQQQQLADYAKELAARHTHFHLVYLNESGKPSEHSVNKETLRIWEANGQISCVTYSALIGWLQSCLAEIHNPSVAEFIQQLIRFIQRKFQGISDMSEQDTVIETIICDANSIEAAITINTHLFAAKQRLMHKLLDDLQKIAVDYPDMGVKAKSGFLGNYKNTDGFNFDLGAQQFFIGFGFDGTNFSQPWISVNFKQKAETSDNKQLIEKLHRYIQENKVARFKRPFTLTTEDDWPAWYWFSHTEHYTNDQSSNWNHDPLPWQMIASGQMAEKIMQEVRGLYDFIAPSLKIEIASQAA